MIDKQLFMTIPEKGTLSKEWANDIFTRLYFLMNARYKNMCLILLSSSRENITVWNDDYECLQAISKLEEE